MWWTCEFLLCSIPFVQYFDEWLTAKLIVGLWKTPCWRMNPSRRFFLRQLCSSTRRQRSVTSRRRVRRRSHLHESGMTLREISCAFKSE